MESMRHSDRQANRERATAGPGRPGAPRGASILALADDAYPRLLREINDPPDRIWVKGSLPHGHGIAVVGSRACTPSGRRIAHRLGVDLARAGLVVVSGLARGIDSAAHRGALDGGGETIAVLPCGIDRVYPPANRVLARRIAASGALISELEPGTEVRKSSFVQRNRIIAGLALAVVVVEAARQSGAKITAAYAADYDRELLAVPGSLASAVSEGAIELLIDGAAICTGVESVLEQLRPAVANPARRRLERARGSGASTIAGLDDAGRAVLEAISERGGCSVDGLANATRLGVGTLLAVLTDLEVRGLIRSVGSQRYERA